MNMKELFENGTMCYLQKVGIVSPTVFRYKELNDELQNTQKQLDCSKRQAVSVVAEKCRAGEKTVWRAAKIMKK